MKQYLDLLQDIMDNGRDKVDRTNTGTRSVFGRQMRFDLKKGFPLVTTKKIHLKSVIHELLWFLNGDTNVAYLQDNGVRIWNEWADEEGDLGPIYGRQWREWIDYKMVDPHCVERIRELLHRGYECCGVLNNGVQKYLSYVKHHDQIANVMQQLKKDPDSRRIIVSAWNVGDLDDMALPACHSFYQFYTHELTIDERVDYVRRNDVLRTQWVMDDVRRSEIELWLNTHNVPTRALSCMLTARSQDALLGTPFNIASYSLLTHMLAQQLNMDVGEFVWTGGDCHIYRNHFEQVKEQLSREPYPLPKLTIVRKPESITDYRYEDFVFVGYQSHPAIKAKVAV